MTTTTKKGYRVAKEVKDQILANLKREKQDILFSFYSETKIFPVKANKILAVQLFTNIITNAVNYSSKEDGGIEISLKKEGGKKVFTCKDNGIGIPTNEQERVFSKFFRASNVSELKQGGTGLGLFIVKKICDGFGWEISFKSPIKNGRGTIFSVKIPQSPSS